MACAPTCTNWIKPDKPPIVAQSPTCTWPASVAPLASTQWLPNRTSWATCT